MPVGQVGSLYVEIGADLKPLKDKLQEAQKSVQQLEKDIQNNTQKTVDNISKLGTGLTIGVTAPLAAASIAAIKFASDLNETQQKVDVVFGDSAQVIKDWASTAVEQMGLASETAMSAAARYGNMADGMGLTADVGLEMAMSLTQLSADLASFNNTSQETAQIALDSVFTGETETLKQYGIVMTEVNLEQFAMQQGITKTYREMTQAEKVQLRYNYVLANTTNAQGDFARTSDSVANQTRIAQEQLKELAATFGNNLLPIASKVLGGLNDLLKGFNNLDTETQKFIITVAGIAAAAGPAIKLGTGVYNVVQKLKNALKSLEIKKITSEITKYGTSATAANKGMDLLIAGMKKADGTFYTTQEIIAHNTAEFEKMGVSSSQAAGAIQATAIGFKGTGESAKGAVPGVKSFGVALNSALGIVGIVTTAVTALVAVLSAVTAPSEEMEEFSAAAEEFKTSADEATKSAEENLFTLEAQKEQLPDLIDRLYELNDAEILSSGQQTEMANIVAQLNSQYSGLGLSIDSTTGKLNMSRSELEESTEAIYDNAKAMAMQEAYYDAIKSQVEAEGKRAIAIKKVREEWKKLSSVASDYVDTLSDEEIIAMAVNDATYNMFSTQYAYNGNVRAGLEAVRDYNEVLEDSGDMLEYITENVDSDTQAMWANTTSTEENTEAKSGNTAATKDLTEAEATLLLQRLANGEKLTEEENANLETWRSINEERAAILEEAVQRETELYQARVDAASDMNDKIELENQTSLAQATENLQNNTQIVNDMVNNLDSLYGKIPESLQSYLEEAGTDQARLIAELAEHMKDGGDEVANNFISAYEAALEAGKTPIAAVSEAIGDTTTESTGAGISKNDAAQTEAKTQMEETVETMREIVEGGNFYYLGMGIINNMTKGMRQVRQNLIDEATSIMSSVKSAMSLTVSAQTTSSGARIKAYDVGGYFTDPQIIQIAEKRPEFVGAAEDLESFISKSVNNAFVGVNPIVTRPVSMPAEPGSNSVKIEVSVPMQISKSLTDAEISAKAKSITRIVRREFAKVTGGSMN